MEATRPETYECLHHADIGADKTDARATKRRPYGSYRSFFVERWLSPTAKVIDTKNYGKGSYGCGTDWKSVSFLGQVEGTGMERGVSLETLLKRKIQ